VLLLCSVPQHAWNSSTNGRFHALFPSQDASKGISKGPVIQIWRRIFMNEQFSSGRAIKLLEGKNYEWRRNEVSAKETWASEMGSWTPGREKGRGRSGARPEDGFDPGDRALATYMKELTFTQSEKWDGIAEDREWRAGAHGWRQLWAMPLLWPGDLTKATERCSLDSLLHRLPAESGRERWGIEERLKVTRRFAQWREKLELRGSDGGGAGFGCN
jgi:hypothetical protein